MTQDYRNLKNLKIYKVLFNAINKTDSQDGKSYIVYHEENKLQPVYVRETEEFLEKFIPVEDQHD